VTFVERPISAACLAIAAALLIAPLIPALSRRRERVAVEQQR